ncbi:MAG: hypothetical protein M1830_003834 [Pleopsidium flavum]|nr:MAG: hypothetical protein M1830_003834 [Pleopsidium flavum]
MVKGIVPSNNGHYLTLQDVVKHAVLTDDADLHACPTRLIVLENTLGGTVLPLAECARITAWARSHQIPTHLDGARLWEAVAAGAGSLSDYSSLFSSVSLCFSKGLGAPIGSILVGNEAFIKRARWVRKSIGGGTRQAGVVTAAARVAVDETFGKGAWGEGGLLRGAQERARVVGGMWEARGGRLGREVETNMVWLDLESAGCGVEEFVQCGVREGIKVLGGRVVVHYQIGEEGIRRLGRVMDWVLMKGKGEKKGEGGVVVNGISEEEKKEAEKVMAPEME